MKIHFVNSLFPVTIQTEILLKILNLQSSNRSENRRLLHSKVIGLFSELRSQPCFRDNINNI